MRRELGIQVEHQAAVQVGEPGELARLDQEARAGAHHRRPGVLVAGVLGDPHHLQPPVLRIGALVADALEGNPDLDLVAPGGQMPPGLVNEIGAEVDDAVEPAGRSAAAARGPGVLPLAAHAVLLHPQGVHAELQGAAVVIVGVEQDLDVVVRRDIVAVGERGANDRAVALEGADAEIDRVRGVPDENFRGVVRRPAVDWPVLRESREPGRLSPRRLVEVAVDDDRGVDAGDPHVEVPGAAVVHGPGVGGDRGELEQQRKHGIENSAWCVVRGTLTGI